MITSKAIDLAYGILSRVLTAMFKPRKKHWVFGSNFGKTYGEGPRCIMEYVMRNDKSIRCTWITNNKDVCRELRQKGIRCRMNRSLSGVWEIVKADVVFSSHSGIDVSYAYRRVGRRTFYLMHGQTTKASYCASTLGYYINVYGLNWLQRSFTEWLHDYFCEGYSYRESEFVSYTSDFVMETSKSCFPVFVEGKVLGSPRNDVLFDKSRMTSAFFEPFKGKMVVTYMPTHRMFGKGGLSPRLFAADESKIQWLRSNNVVVLIKQHPNMIPLIDETLDNDVVIDISKCGLDPLVVTANADVLVTDYSSVWLDYMLLKRPLAHYVYDDFSTKDQGIFDELYEYPDAHFCYTEDELFEFVKRCREDYDGMKPSEETVRLFHRYADGKSAERHYNEIIKMYGK